MAEKQNAHTIRYGNKDGEIKFGHITDSNEIDAFIVRSGAEANHYIEMCSTGDSHLKHGTICRSTGAFQIVAGDNVPKDVFGVYIDSKAGDLVLRSSGRIKLIAKNIDFIADGEDGKNGVINIQANEKINLNSNQINVKAKVTLTMESVKSVNLIGRSILNIYGGFIEFLDGATSVKGPLGTVTNFQQIINKK